MLDHTGFVVTDLAKARRFYDAIAKPLELMTADNGPDAFLLGKSPTEYPYLWIGTLIPSYWIEGSRPGINQMHVAFAAKSKAMVDAFYRAALDAGAKTTARPARAVAPINITAPSSSTRMATTSKPVIAAPTRRRPLNRHNNSRFPTYP